MSDPIVHAAKILIYILYYIYLYKTYIKGLIYIYIYIIYIIYIYIYKRTYIYIYI